MSYKALTNGILVPDTINTKNSVDIAEVASMLDGDKAATWQNFASYSVASREAYIKNVISARCIKYIASAVGSIKWTILDNNGDPLDNHPILDLLKRPNPQQGTSLFFATLQMHKLLDGNAYVRAVKLSDGDVIGGMISPTPNEEPVELELLRPDRVFINVGTGRLPISYTYTELGGTYNFLIDQINGDCSLLQIGSPHPLQDHIGLSATQQAATAINLHNEASEFNKKLLENGAAPRGMLSVQVDLNEDERNKLKEDLRRNFQGASNAGKTFVSSKDVTFQQLGSTPKDIEFEKGKMKAAIDICLAYGIAPEVLGFGETTYANRAEATLDTWSNTILPEVDVICTEFNNFLSEMYGDEAQLSYDEDAISALAPRREKRTERIIMLYEKGLITQTEARSELGFMELVADLQPKPEDQCEHELKPVDLSAPEKPITPVEDEKLPEPEETKEAVIHAPDPVDHQLAIETQELNLAELTTNIHHLQIETKLAKNKDLLVKAADIDLSEVISDIGEFSGYASRFDTGPDTHMDTIAAGAYTRTINNLKQSGRVLPVRFNHDSSYSIGGYLELIQDDIGLFVRGKLDLEDERAMQVYSMIKARLITGLSIGYFKIASVPNEYGGDYLTEVALVEISIVNVPSQSVARITEVKMIEA